VLNPWPLAQVHNPSVAQVMYPVVSVQTQRSFGVASDPNDSKVEGVNGPIHQFHYVNPEKTRTSKDIFIQQRIPSQPSS